MPELTSFSSLLTGTTLLAFVVTACLAYLGTRLRHRPANAFTAGISPVMPDDSLTLPVEHDDPDFRESVGVSNIIANFMVADEWTEIADFIADWEANLTSTPGGIRYHEVATQTCLSGLQGLLDDAPRNSLSDLNDADVELGHFMDTHRQTPENHVLALLAARAHIAVGEACRADNWPEDQRRNAWRKMAQHFIAAGEILEAFDPLSHMSPLLAEAHYRQALGAPGGADRLPSIFDDWIDLDPSNSNIYNTHVSAMVLNNAFSGDDVLREAELAMQRTEDTLGFGGYALFFMPLLVEYDSAREFLDGELYANALLDLASNSATQAEVNHAAAALLTGIEGADENTAAAFRDALILLVRQHLQVIYPRFWPISVEEIQELVVEAAMAAPDIGPAERKDAFVSSRQLSEAA